MNRVGRSGERVRSCALAVLVAVVGGLAIAPGAEAVFPGAKGRLNSQVCVTNGERCFLKDLRFSPDGSRVVGSLQGWSYEQRDNEIWVANSDGTEPRKLVDRDFGDSNPTWAPDGKRVLFVRAERAGKCSADGEGVSSGLQTVDVETGARATIVPQDVCWGYQDIEWSADGQIIVGGYETDAYGATLFRVNPTTGARSGITELNGFDNARISPDGSLIVAGANRYLTGFPPSPEIRVVKSDAPAEVVASFTTQSEGGINIEPTFTPDGKSVSWPDCRPDCGVWSRTLPTAEQPELGPPVLDVPGAGSPLDWEPIVDAPLITGGPQGTVASATATFEFAVPDARPGRYQCRLLGIRDWQTCASPKTYRGLPDGEHVFEVRYVLQGDADADDNPVATRTWKSDTKPPTALLDQAPSGTTSSTEATFVFRSTEPGATFRCSLDGAPQVDCTSPVRAVGLGEGEHSFAVRAADAVGNEQRSATQASWTVSFASTGGDGPGPPGDGAAGGGVTPPKPPSAGCEHGKVQAGVITAIARGGCFRPRAKGARDVFVTTGPISLNGIQITPASGSSIVVDPKLADVEVSWTGPVTMGFDEVTWTIPFAMTLPIGKADSAAKFALPVFEKLQDKIKVAGLKIAVAPRFELTGDDGGTTKVGLKIALPSSFRGLKADGDTNSDKAGGLTFDFGFSSSNDKGARFAIKGQIDTAWLWSKVKLTDVGIGLDTGPPLAFEATATLTLNESKLPTGISREQQFTATLGFTKDEGQWPNLQKVAIGASKFQKPLAKGFYLQRFGGEFTACGGADGGAGKFTANAGVSFGARIDVKPFFEGEPVSVDGKLALTLCKDPSVEISDGEGKVVEVKLVNAGVKYPFGGAPELSGGLDLSYGPYGYRAKIEEAWFALERPARFNIRSSSEFNLPGLAGELVNGKTETVLSSKGFAACYGPVGRRFGIGKLWGQPLGSDFSGTCDVGNYAVSASAAQAGDRAVSIPPRTRIAVVAVRGIGGAPKVTLAGPGGRSVTVPDGPEVLQTDQAIVVQDGEAAATRIVLLDPPAGTWRVTPGPLSVPVTGTSAALGRPDVAVRGTSRPAKHGKRRLKWQLTPAAGQRVEFVEVGEGSAAVLASTTRARGSVAYRPAAGPNGRRTIEAIVTQDGLPRARRVVARYAVSVSRPSRPGRARARGSAISWSQAGDASRWSVLLRGPGGRTRALDVRRPRVVRPRSWPRRKISVLVVAVGRDGRTGARRTTVLRRAKRAVHGVGVARARRTT